MDVLDERVPQDSAPPQWQDSNPPDLFECCLSPQHDDRHGQSGPRLHKTVFARIPEPGQQEVLWTDKILTPRPFPQGQNRRLKGFRPAAAERPSNWEIFLGAWLAVVKPR